MFVGPGCRSNDRDTVDELGCLCILILGCAGVSEGAALTGVEVDVEIGGVESISPLLASESKDSTDLGVTPPPNSAQAAWAALVLACFLVSAFPT